MYQDALKRLSDTDAYVVVIGAMDGISHDSLYPHLARNAHWSGLLVEPVPHYFAQLQENYGLRENLRFENCAIGSAVEDSVMYTVRPQSIADQEVPDWCNGISTFNVYGPTISADGIREHVQTLIVRCRPFVDLVEAAEITRIDILQIDAEGADYEIFQQVWACGFRPEVIHIEIVQMTGEDRDALKQTLETSRYSVIQEGDDITAVKGVVEPGRGRRKRVAFFTQSEWAFGSIHAALCRELYSHGIDADIIDWERFPRDAPISDAFDLFITNPGNPLSVLVNEYGVPEERICGIAHGRNDLVQAVQLENDIDALAGFAGIGASLQQFAADLNISRSMSILQNGIQFDRFYRPVSLGLKTLGYAGVPSYVDDSTATDCKRSSLASALSERLALPLRSAFHRHYLLMPEYYEGVDAVVVSSDQYEACGLPLMEAAAAGRLPVSSLIGTLCRFPNPPGIILPLEETQFVDRGVEVLSVLVDDNKQFRLLCEEAQEFAYEHYNWPSVLNDWVELILEK